MPKPAANIGSVAKNILTTFYNGNETNLAPISCVASEFLQQSLQELLA
jgi:hypothetical protein